MSNKKDPAIVVMGAGMTGMLVVIKLKEQGFNNVVLLEKAASMGGTWRENTYPGVACDVPSHAYTYSFEPNPDWSSFFPSGEEIYGYFKNCFYKYGLDKHTYFNEAVTHCAYNDQTQQWTIKTSQDKTYVADLLFAATGMLHKPVIPDFKGLENYQGDYFHTAQWNHDVELQGKRIGVIGTGSTACQVIPNLVDMPGTEVTVFQRTPQWIIKTENRMFSDKEKQQFREDNKKIDRIRKMVMFVYDKGTSALTSDTWFNSLLHRLFSWNAKRYLKTAVKDPELRAKLTPDYKVGCKRLVMNSTFYPAIQKPNAHLVVEGIDCFEENGIRSKDGKLHELDVVVISTGFDPAAYMRPMDFYGKNGLSIEDAWARKIQAYRSIFLPDFPNFFLMLGPNSPIGNNSVITMSEIQTDYVLRVIKLWQDEKLETIEASKEAMAEWNALLKERMSHTVWTSGCNSWYLDADGDPLAWPDTWKNWLKAMEDININHFVGSNG